MRSNWTVPRKLSAWKFSYYEEQEKIKKTHRMNKNELKWVIEIRDLKIIIDKKLTKKLGERNINNILQCDIGPY